MLGLIYKDVVSQRMYALLATVFIAVIGYVALTTNFSEDASAGTSPSSFFMLVWVISTYLGCSLIPEMAIKTDKKLQWNVYSLALPTVVQKTVLSKYLLMVGMHVVSFIITVAFTAVVAAVYDIPFDIFPLLTIFGFMTAFDSISYAFIFRFGPERGEIFKIVCVFLLPLAAVMYLFFGDLSIFGENGLYDMMEWFIEFDFSDFGYAAWHWFIIAAALCWTAGYALSCKGYKAE